MSLVSKNRETEQNRKKRVNNIASEVTGSSTSYSVHPLGQKIDREAPGVSPNVFLSSSTQGLWILLPQCLGVASGYYYPNQLSGCYVPPFLWTSLALMLSGGCLPSVGESSICAHANPRHRQKTIVVQSQRHSGNGS